MNQASCNCIVCAQEFNPDEMQEVVLSKINVTNFKVCQACFNISDPEGDYRQVREIINSYQKFSEAKYLFGEVEDILNLRNNS